MKKKRKVSHKNRGYYTVTEIKHMLDDTEFGTMKDTNIRIVGDKDSSLILTKVLVDILTDNGYRVSIGAHKFEKDLKRRMGDYDLHRIRIYINFEKKGR